MEQSQTPFAFLFDGSNITALKYRDGEFHSDLSAFTRPYSGFREMGLSDDSYARAYMACVWLFRAINVRVLKIAEVLRRAQLLDRASGKLITEHPYHDALELSYQLYMQDVYEEWTYSKALYGETYVEKVKQTIVGTFGIPRTIRVLNGLAAEPIITGGAITGYRYQDDSGTVTFAPSEIVFDKTKNPLDDTRGFSLIAAAMDAVNIDRSIIVLTRSHLKNNARPGLIFTPKQGRLTPAEVDLIQTTLAEDSRGPQNAGNPLLMPTAFDVTVADPPKLADVDAMSEQQKRRICSVVGVPVALVDYQDFAFQLSPEQNRTFYELTLIPEAEKILRVANTQVLPFFDPRRAVELRLPIDDIRAELGDPVQRTTIYSTQLRDGAITLNEYRTKLGHKPVLNGDVFYLSAGSIQVPVEQLGKLYGKPSYLPYSNPSIDTDVAANLAQQAGIDVPTPPPVEALAPAPPNGEAAKATIDEDIRKWRKRSTKGNALKAFTSTVIPKHIEDFIRSELEVIGANADRSLVHAVFDDAETVAGIGDGRKAYADTRQSFVDEMIRVIGEGQRSEVSRSKFGGQMRAVCRRALLQAMRDGMNEVDYDPESFSMEELAAFRVLQEETSGYISGLGAEMFKEGGISEGEVAVRADMWASMTLESARELGIKLGKPNQRMKWVRGPTADSCPDCIRLENQVHTMKAWIESGWTPTSKKTECRSYQCLCQLVPTDEPERGGF